MSIEEWLNNNQLSIDIWNNKYRYEDETFEEWLGRVSNHDEVIKRLIRQKKLLFAGRTLSNRGTNKQGSYSNCYSHGFVEDSLDDIMQTASNIAKTFKAQGGQGLSLSKIRPAKSLIGGQYESDGIVPFMEIFNTVTESISQGGSRKGALMMSIDITHPEADKFITIKSDLTKITKANLSVEISDEFMEAVKHKSEHMDCEFHTGNEEVIKYTINPTKLFNLVCECACKTAEPGIIFTNRFRNYNLMEYVDDYQIETCNPCGEQPLPKHGACNLCSINLSEYVTDPYTGNAKFNYDALELDIPFIVRAMDDILSENLTNHALAEQREMAKNYRNLGIGIMGLADALVKLGIRYGSQEAVMFTNNLMCGLFRCAIYASVELGKQRGSFPKYTSDVWDSSIINRAFHPDEIAELKKQNTLRNCSLLSIAPTGLR